MRIKPQFSILTGLTVYFLCLLGPVLPISEVPQRVVDSEVRLILQLIHELSLELAKQLKVVKDLGITCISDVLLFLKQDLESTSFLLALGLDSVPVG